MNRSRLKSIHSINDGTCKLVAERDGTNVELVCRIAVGRGVRMVTSEPDDLDRLGLPPRKLAAAVIAFLDVNDTAALDAGAGEPDAEDV